MSPNRRSRMADAAARRDLGHFETPEAFYSAVAKGAPAGLYPRYWLGEQSYWTVVGVNNARQEALINSDGMVEVDKGCFSIEPFLRDDDSLHTWHNARSSASLAEGYLPLPEVTWTGPPLRLTISAFADGPEKDGLSRAGDDRLYLTYTVANESASRREAVLYLALRPFQVNPPWQFLNWPGGTAPIKTIDYANSRALVNNDKTVHFLDPPHAFGAAALAEGDISAYLVDDRLPLQQKVYDPRGFASAAARYHWMLQPGEKKEVHIIVLLCRQRAWGRGDSRQERKHRELQRPLTRTQARRAQQQPCQRTTPQPEAVVQAREATQQFWRDKIHAVAIHLPESAQDLIATVRANLAYILINRDGPGIQPGSRSYERSWIRDGALTSAALLRFGIRQEVKDYLEWYSRYLYPSGKVPCVVDRRGADPVPENDSNGEYLFAMLQYFHFTSDTTFLRSHYPQIRAAAAYLDTLSGQRMTDHYKPVGNDSLDAFYGLLPESISHEGYSAKPMHSYWDNFFAMRGYNDAVEIARLLGEKADQAWLERSRDRFRENLLASLTRTMRYKGIDYLPGCVELGDFDATSTAIALYPGNLVTILPQPQTQNTFNRYFDFFTRRRDGLLDWRDYTPYETRLIGAFIRLGQPARAQALLDFFMKDRRPAGWRHWAEVVWKDPATPRFIGDMPHTWVGSDFIQSVRTMFLYEDEARQSLVIGAGLGREWIESGEGMSVTGMPTYYGPVSYSFKKGKRGYRIEIEGNMRLPEGGIEVIHHALKKPGKVLINGRKTAQYDGRAVYLKSCPAVIEIID